MGFLDTKDKEGSKKFEGLKNKIRDEGINTLIDPELYPKLLVEQNQNIIELLTEIVRTNRQLIAPELQVVEEPFDITNKYFKSLVRLLGNK